MSNAPNVADHAAPAPSWVARARKFLVAAVGVIAQVVLSGALDAPQYDGLRTWLQMIVGLATAAGVYVVPNAAKRPAA